jgi:hypothetical protein
MENKTKEVIQQEVVTYLNKTSLHLFKVKHLNSSYDETEFYYKVITFEKESKSYYAIITIGQNKVHISVKETLSDTMYQYYGGNNLNLIKRSLFQSYYKTKSIPNFKNFRELVSEIKKEISVNNNTDLIKKIERRASEFGLIDKPIEKNETIVHKITSLFKK